MTTTKVECRELGLDSGPCVEEVASYAYTVQEESSKPQSGVLIEEFSETEEKRSNLGVNRGVTIVSVSDDESTLKALSRDVSTEDVQAVDLPEDLKTTNDILDELYLNGSPENVRLHRMSKITEAIAEERSSEEPLSAVLSSQAPQRESVDVKEVKLPGQSSTISDVSSAKKVAEKTLDEANSAMEEEGLSKQKGEIVGSSPKKITEEAMGQAQTPSLDSNELSKKAVKHERIEASQSEALSRQNSEKAVADDDEGIDDEMKDLLARVKRQRSVLDEILDKESGRESGTIARFHRWLHRQLVIISQRYEPCDAVT